MTTQFLEVLWIAIAATNLSLFLSFLYISHPVGIWYFKQVNKLRTLEIGEPGNPYLFQKKNKWNWLAKILGDCIYCQNTWIFLILFFLLDICPTNKVVWLVIGSGLNYGSLEVWLYLRDFLNRMPNRNQ